jgi:predicted nucleic acid-binding Zn ribbon protein
LPRLPNPLRSEAEAFRMLIYLILTLAVIVAIVLVVRAVT